MTAEKKVLLLEASAGVAFNICLFSLFFMHAYVCLSTCMCTMCIQEPSEVKGHLIPQTGVASSCEQPCECWELDRALPGNAVCVFAH